MQGNFQKGNIVDVDLGQPPKEVKGHEQGNERPCIVIKAFPQLQLLVVIPCTSKEPKYNHYTIVRIAKGSGGLVLDSYALCHQIRTVSFERVSAVRGSLTGTDLLKVQSVLSDILDL